MQEQIENKAAMYAYLRAEARKAEDLAKQGNCIEKWMIAADKWERAMPYSGFTEFRIKLTEAMFGGEFQQWLKEHSEAHKQYLQRKAAKES